MEEVVAGAGEALGREIPTELLPTDWLGRRAQELFENRRTRWGPDAGAWYKELEATHDG